MRTKAAAKLALLLALGGVEAMKIRFEDLNEEQKAHLQTVKYAMWGMGDTYSTEEYRNGCARDAVEALVKCLFGDDWERA
jgi:hypothetical protein